ncbi:hypothetical protein HY628_02865 [Candidatus Uhrbacteria bacterium]|nr:hypothetical protein [Candidatus Uhrbacteria bacterium]
MLDRRQRRKQLAHRCLLGGLTILFVFEIAAVTLLFRPRQVAAQGAPDVVAWLTTNKALEQVQSKTSLILRTTVYQAIFNAVNFFLQRIAYDTAVWLASGGKGQGALAFKEGWDNYFKNTALDAAGQFIGDISAGLNAVSGQVGAPVFDFCAPATPQLQIKLQLGLASSFSQQPQPRCSWNQIKQNWENVYQSFETRDILNQIGVSFEPGQTSLSATLAAQSRAVDTALNKLSAKAQERIEGRGFKAVTDVISGNIKTPSAVIEEKFNDILVRGTSEQRRLAAEAAFTHPEFLQSAVLSVVSTFVNTLASQLLNRVTGGFFSVGDAVKERSIYNPELASVGNREEALRIYADQQTAPIQNVNSYDVLLEFTSCPTPRGPTNCVIDDKFAAAVREAAAGKALTVQEAIEGNLIDPSFKLIPPTDQARNQDPYCFTYGFCYSNLVKLRKARILPIGWELAAASPYNSVGSPVELREVMAGFNQCNEKGEADADNRWCHLIDPNWILKYPATQCRALVFGETLATSAGDGRAEVCVDTPSCTSEDGQGGCLGSWGYCTRERNIWRFDGDACPAYFSSCQSFTGGPDNKQLAVRTNTVDFGACTADGAGCRWYSTGQSFVDSAGDRICLGGGKAGQVCTTDAQCPSGVCLPDEQPFVTTPKPDTLAWQPASRLYLNRQAKECDASNAGCTELIPRRGQVTLNLARNSSFEEDKDQAAGPDFWNGAASVYSTDATKSFHGSDAVVFRTSAMNQRIAISPSQFYTMSFYGRRAASGSPRAMLRADLFRADGSPVSVANLFTTCQASGNGYLLEAANLGDNYGRFSCTFTSPSQVAYLVLGAASASSNDEVVVDAVQLEENEFVTPYGEGYSGSGAGLRVSLKKPPAGLCTGSPNDPDACQQYASVCQATEVGCERYTPISGDPAIPGIVRPADQCPAACLGYETFREEPTNFDLTGDYPLYFIPSTARACSAVNAGCDEFTNLEAGPTAESREYFTYLRLCEEPQAGDDTGVFYTWEGSEEAGFQLRTWQLKKSQSGNPQNTTTDPSGGVAPCTAYQAQNGVCADAAPFVAPDTCNERGDIFSNPDCREFYGEDGKIHYRLYSKTVLKTAACTDYRKTVSNQTDCQASGGRWQAATNQCFYRAHLPENNSCPSSENSCRLYTGNAGRNVETLISEDFEKGVTAGFDGAVISNESVATTGRSLSKATGTATVQRYIDSRELAGRTLLLSFWAKGSTGRQLEIKIGSSPANRYFSVADADSTTPTAELSSDWRSYELGPVPIDWNVSNPPQTCTLGNACNQDGGCECQSGAGARQCQVAKGQTSCQYDTFEITVKNRGGSNDASAQLFLDNLRIKTVAQTMAVVRDSWRTPAVCDATPEGAYAAQAMLGCEEYRDRGGNTVYLKSFSQLCREKAIGCGAFFDTQNSSSPYAESWNYICRRPDRGSGGCSVDPDGPAGPAAGRQVCTIAPGSDRCTFKWDGSLIDSNPGNTYSAALPLKFVDGTGPAAAADGFPPAGARTAPIFYGDDLTVAPADHTVYLVDTPQGRCKPEAKGCQALGLPKFDKSLTAVEGYHEVYRLNLPDSYGQTLCRGEQLFCEAWTSSLGAEFYFKDPQEKVCEYRESGSAGTFGWFQTGTDSPCYGNFVVGQKENGLWTNRAVCALPGACAEANGCDCPAGAAIPSVQCVVAQGQTSCSPYQGWAGLCKSEFAGCTEFLDKTDTGRNDLGDEQWPGGKPQTIIKNDRLRDDLRPASEQCQGLVSQKAGCALFHDTSSGVLTWNAGASYLKSDKNNFEKVTPVDCASPAAGDASYCQRCSAGGKTLPNYCLADADCPVASQCKVTVIANDSNAVLAVRRDRECAEWLACSSPQPVFDPRQNKWVTACSSLDVCNAPAPVKDTTACQYVMEKPEPQPLDPARYVARAVTWSGLEYSGYSIPGKYPIDALRSVNVGACVPADFMSSTLVISPTQAVTACNSDSDCKDSRAPKCVPHFRLGRVLASCGDLAPGAACSVGRCSVSGSIACGLNQDCPSNESCVLRPEIDRGFCYNHQCARPPSGELVALTIPDSRTSESAACRAYPEENSPFPSVASLVRQWNDRGTPDTARDDTPETVAHGFQSAKLCAKGEQCECTYRKATYGGLTRYFADDGIPTPSGICESGGRDKIGSRCSTDDECQGTGTVPGVCAPLERLDRFLGLSGYCLERDQATTINGDPKQFGCLTWLPIDQLAGAPSLYHQFAEAGFVADPGEEWYCSDASPLTVDQFEKYDALKQGDPPPLQGPRLELGWFSDRTKLNNAVGHGVPFLGEPDHNTPCEEKNGALPASCLDAHLHPGEGDGDCEENSSSAWCIFPQRSCEGHPGIQTVGAGYCPRTENDRGPINDQARLNFDPSSLPEPKVTAPEHGTNFFGCYEIADRAGSGPNVGRIHYPWQGPPIYRWQVEQFEVTRLDATIRDSTAGPCTFFTGEPNSGDIGDDDKLAPDQRFFGTERTPNDPPLFTGDGAEMSVYPIWDAEDKLVGLGVQAADEDGKDELAFFISGLTVHFWPSCSALARAGAPNQAAPYTDRLLAGHYSAPDLRIKRETEYAPWGAVCERNTSRRGLVTFDSGKAEAACQNDTKGLFDASHLLSDLFARSWTVERLPGFNAANKFFALDKDWRYDSAPSEKWDATETADGGAAGAPVVRPVKECLAGVCSEVEGRDSLSVNNQYFDEVGGKRQLRANISFFMYADKNRLPIRRLVIDWGDGSPIYDQSGSFKNYRPTCDQNLWGANRESCLEGPLEIQHDYKCNAAVLARLPLCDARGRPPVIGGYRGGRGGCKTIENTCAFVPRVMVTDNWGWCASENTDGLPGGDGCPGAPGSGGCYDARKNINYPLPRPNECDADLPNADISSTANFNETDKNPWVYFDGRIVVEP